MHLAYKVDNVDIVTEDGEIKDGYLEVGEWGNIFIYDYNNDLKAILNPSILKQLVEIKQQIEWDNLNVPENKELQN